MSKNREMKIYGYVMIVLGIVDLGFLMLNISNAKTLLATQTPGISIAVYGILGLFLLIALAKIWMGRQGLCYAKGTGKGTSHITLSKIGMVFCAIVLVLDCVELISGNGFNSDAISNMTSLIIMYSYHKCAKEML